jgi:hypothetical protein
MHFSVALVRANSKTRLGLHRENGDQSHLIWQLIYTGVISVLD